MIRFIYLKETHFVLFAVFRGFMKRYSFFDRNSVRIVAFSLFLTIFTSSKAVRSNTKDGLFALYQVIMNLSYLRLIVFIQSSFSRWNTQCASLHNYHQLEKNKNS